MNNEKIEELENNFKHLDNLELYKEIINNKE